jgi:hypothetical protein
VASPMILLGFSRTTFGRALHADKNQIILNNTNKY